MKHKNKIVPFPFIHYLAFAGVFIAITIVPLLLFTPKFDPTTNGINKGNEEQNANNTQNGRDGDLSIFDSIYDFFGNANISQDDLILAISLSTLLLLILDFIVGKKKIRKNIFNIFWRITYPKKLKRFKKLIKEKHENIKLPFRPGINLNMSELFIPLKAEEYTMVSKEINSEVSINYLLNKFKNIVITGPPGSGKSLLCKNILYKYSINNLNSINSNSIPVLIKLHQYQGGFSIINEIKKIISPILKDQNEIENILTNGNLILMLDGFDEVRNSQKNEMVTNIISFINSYSKCQYIITCRNAVYKREFDNICIGKFILIEFNESQIRSYLNVYNKNETFKTQALLKSLRERPALFNLAKNPLMLALIAFLSIDEGRTLPHSRGEFYSQAIDILLEKHSISSKIIYNIRDKAFLLLQTIAWKVHTSQLKLSQSSKEIKRIEIENIIEEELKFNHEEVDLFYNEVLLKSGLIPIVDKGNQTHEFIHFSLQEYLVAHSCKSDYSLIIKNLQEDKSQWLEIAKLWCSLPDTNISDFISEVKSIDSVLALECLAETFGKINFEIEKELINPHLVEIEKGEQFNERVSEAFGNIITTKSNNEEKGEYLFNNLKKQFEQTTNEDKITFISKAFATSSILESANLLVKHYDKHENVFTALTSMGELVVPFLVEIAKNNNIKSLYCLKNINTSESIKALEQFIWLEETSDLAIHSSWILSNVMQDERALKILNSISIIQDKKNKNSMKWIWKPFDISEQTSIFHISNRISFIICNYLLEKSNIIEAEIEQRIAIPIAIELFSYNESLGIIGRSLITESIKDDFLAIYETNTPPSKKMWQDISHSKGNESYYNFHLSDESMGIWALSLPLFCSVICLLSESTRVFFNIILTILIVIFFLLYALKLNNKYLPHRQSNLNKFGFRNFIIELPIYGLLISFLVFASNRPYENLLSYIGIIGVNVVFLSIIQIVFLSIYYESKSKNPLKILLSLLENTRHIKGGS